MGSKHSKELKITAKVLNTRFSLSCEKSVYEDGTKSSTTKSQIFLHKGTLKINDEEYFLSAVDRPIKFSILNPIKQSLKLFLKNGEMWKLHSPDLGNLLLLKYYISVSMRPELKLNQESCKKCSRRIKFFTRRFNCMCCGHLFCSKCCPNLTQLNFLGYIYDERICEKCKDSIVIPIKNQARDEESGKNKRIHRRNRRLSYPDIRKSRWAEADGEGPEVRKYFTGEVTKNWI